jgi:micrococcal nuclease
MLPGLAAAVLLALPIGAVQGAKDLIKKQFTATVVSVIDGDTVDVLIPPGRRERVRLHGMDAPESGEPFSVVARNFLRVMLFTKDVVLDGRDVDRYGRLVARITVDGEDPTVQTIAAGLACTFHTYSREPVLDAAMAGARESRLGFWAQPKQLPSCVAREAASSQLPLGLVAQPGLVGNVSSRLFHSSSCPNARCKNCTRQFTTRQQAEEAGFRPSRDCIRRLPTDRH